GMRQMAKSTYVIVFDQGEAGELFPVGEPKRFADEESAARTAEKLASRHAGVMGVIDESGDGSDRRVFYSAGEVLQLCDLFATPFDARNDTPLLDQVSDQARNSSDTPDMAVTDARMQLDELKEEFARLKESAGLILEGVQDLGKEIPYLAQQEFEQGI